MSFFSFYTYYFHYFKYQLIISGLIILIGHSDDCPNDWVASQPMQFRNMLHMEMDHGINMKSNGTFSIIQLFFLGGGSGGGKLKRALFFHLQGLKVRGIIG